MQVGETFTATPPDESGDWEMYVNGSLQVVPGGEQTITNVDGTESVIPTPASVIATAPGHHEVGFFRKSNPDERHATPLIVEPVTGE